MISIEAALPVIDALLDERLGLDCLWVFGSATTGRDRPDSDLDLAALFRRRPTAEELFGVRADLESALGRAVDLVDLDHASPILSMQVLRGGRLLVDRDPARRVRLTALVPQLREDLLIIREPIERGLRQRFLDGRS